MPSGKIVLGALGVGVGVALGVAAEDGVSVRAVARKGCRCDGGLGRAATTQYDSENSKVQRSQLRREMQLISRNPSLPRTLRMCATIPRSEAPKSAA